MGRRAGLLRGETRENVFLGSPTRSCSPPSLVPPAIPSPPPLPDESQAADKSPRKRNEVAIGFPAAPRSQRGALRPRPAVRGRRHDTHPLARRRQHHGAGRRPQRHPGLGRVPPLLARRLPHPRRQLGLRRPERPHLYARGPLPAHHRPGQAGRLGRHRVWAQRRSWKPHQRHRQEPSRLPRHRKQHLPGDFQRRTRDRPDVHHLPAQRVLHPPLPRRQGRHLDLDPRQPLQHRHLLLGPDHLLVVLVARRRVPRRPRGRRLLRAPRQLQRPGPRGPGPRRRRRGVPHGPRPHVAQARRLLRRRLRPGPEVRHLAAAAVRRERDLEAPGRQAGYLPAGERDAAHLSAKLFGGWVG
ncbi:hypothetical protein CTA2_7274 [Colletotrichum tanaceti]|uniref:Uncharacterized protein n=1 Tax=Colletotrichum tanaceti TaxID=1306861 RepID=A0A4U6XNA1_9PEZI|nr:hypothetical protein CTA2_7274 [Colletotrichum tanaceti]TKW57177.1 hypothetical protein CTA1_6650 [Colletotrichum tanaceti]